MNRLCDNLQQAIKRSRKSRASKKKNKYQKNLRMEPLEDRRMFCNLMVNSTADIVNFGDNLLTLREAILLHNQPSQYVSKLSGAEKSKLVDPDSLGKGLDTIHLENLQGAVFDLNSHLDTLKGHLTILGAGPDKTTVERSNSAGNFSIFTVDTNAIVTFSGLMIAKGNGSSGGGIFNRGALTTIVNCDLKNDTTNGAGGGIFNDVNSKMIINSSTIENCMTFGDGGGGIYNQGSMELHHTTVKNCAVAIGWGSRPVEAVAGGGIYNSGNMIIDMGSVVMGNHGTWGAGIENLGYRGHDQSKRCAATLTIRDSVIQNNTANYSQYYVGPTPCPMGGGINNKWATLNVYNSTFTGNGVIGYFGGAICNTEGTLNVSGSNFSSNWVKSGSDNWPGHPNGGGAIYSWNSPTVVQIQNSCQFTDNSAYSTSGNAGRGGAILCTGDLTINNGKAYFYQNTADVDGGAIYCDGWAKISGAEFDANTAKREGGAIYATGRQLDINNCVFGKASQNPSPTHVVPNGGNHATLGGAISNHTPGYHDISSVRNSNFQFNTADASGGQNGLGGAIYNVGPLLVDTCMIRNNQARKGGGIYNMSGSSNSTWIKLSLINSTLDANSASETGGGLCNTGSADIQGSTISNCVAGQGSGNGGGLFNDRSGRMGLVNSTVWGNIAGSGGGIYSLGDLDLLFDTIANNKALMIGGVGGVYENPEVTKSAHLHARNTLIALNQGMNQSAQLKPSDLVTRAVDSVLTYCLIGDGDSTGADFTHGNNLYGTYLNPLDPKIEDLADNGGPTKTCKLHADSKAYAAGSADANIKWDQRGKARKDKPDIGAYELHLYK